jgi:hypothetical protein
MSRSLQAEVDIQASAERVWEVLTDFAAYPEWNPFIVQAAGEPVPGQRLELHMRLSGRRGMTIRPEVLEADPGRVLRWLGRLLVPGLFDGEHRFTIQPSGPGRVRLTQHEKFGGLLAPLLLAMIAKPTLASFHQMNQALKARLEQPAPTRTAE